MIPTFTLPEGSVADLSDRAVFSLTGPDTDRYLSGQITQDVKLATESSAVYTCITNAKGKIQGEAFVRRHKGSVLIDCPAELKDDLFNRLDMYLIADDVELVDVSEQYHFYHVLGETSPANAWTVNRYGVAGFDVLETPTAVVTNADEFKKLRLSHAIPAWGAELSEDILPPEAKVEARAISYTKGCYIGQEVISRMKSAGKVTKSLTKFTLSASVDLPFAIANPNKPEAKPIGTITSLAQVNDQWIGLGYLATKFKDTDQLICDSVNITPISNV